MKLFNFVITGFLFAGFLASCDQLPGGGGTASMETEDDSVSYSVGVSIGNNMKGQIDDFKLELVMQGLQDVLNEKELAIAEEQCQQIVQAYAMRKQQEQMAEAQQKGTENLEKGEAFLEENAQKEGIKTTESGLQYEVLEEGSGASPSAEDEVTVHYHGTLLDGTVFDSSVERGEPTSFPLNRVIPGWTEGLQLMKTGAKYKFYIPSDLAYGPRGAGEDIGPNETLIFEVELLSINE